MARKSKISVAKAKPGRGGKRAGAGRKPVYTQPMVTVAGQVTEREAAELDQWAKDRGISRSQAIAQAVRGLHDL